MERKSDAVRRLVASGDYKSALRIASNFRLGITQEDRDTMKLGYECMATSPRFYRSLGYNVDECVRNGISVLVRIYGQ